MPYVKRKVVDYYVGTYLTSQNVSVLVRAYIKS